MDGIVSKLLCNQCLTSITFCKFYSQSEVQCPRYVIMFFQLLRQVSGFLIVLQFPPQTKIERCAKHPYFEYTLNNNVIQLEYCETMPFPKITGSFYIFQHMNNMPKSQFNVCAYVYVCLQTNISTSNTCIVCCSFIYCF